MTAAAFQATYADWRVIKGRKVVQVCFEIPLEAADTAYQVLGGMPIAAKEVWCGIARLTEGGRPNESDPTGNVRRMDDDNGNPVGAHREASNSITPTPRPSVVPASAAEADNLDIPPELDRRRKSPAQIAGYLCTTVPFQKFLFQRFQDQWDDASGGAPFIEPEGNIAAEVVRTICNVKSRADLTDKNVEWNALLLAFRLWENHPELEDA